MYPCTCDTQRIRTLLACFQKENATFKQVCPVHVNTFNLLIFHPALSQRRHYVDSILLIYQYLGEVHSCPVWIDFCFDRILFLNRPLFVTTPYCLSSGVCSFQCKYVGLMNVQSIMRLSELWQQFMLCQLLGVSALGWRAGHSPGRHCWGGIG